MYDQLHWNGNVAILTKISSFTAPEIVETTISSAVGDENFVKPHSVQQW